ncbi:S-layer homology domain-containing protein [Brachybacterium sp. GU-2]|uniref:S-layer homology domain-containing protein n=1 Tax=Brachybacterium sp. GU-2 TaxID=3069708 RepID=UPI00280B0D62|nr:S-layer homology domain-containing protein [Brachybacterium sp. GU-2]WME22694.1 S-layer homology domain-containing protein [Brachybacterium sp. GU-2]
MALRRPAAPRVRPDRPGAPTPAAARAVLVTPTAPAPAPVEAPTTVQPPSPAAAPALPEVQPGAFPAAPRTVARAPEPRPVGPAPARSVPPRRTLLLAGAAAAAVVGAISAGVALPRVLGPATSPFSDVADGDAGLEAMVWAEETGVLPAAGGAFSPEAVVTRGEVAAALHRFAGTPAVPLEDVPVLIVDLGEDPAQASALLWLHGRGALWGDAELKVHPEDPASREGASGMLAALLRPALAGIGAVWPSGGADGSGAAEGKDIPGGISPDAAWLTSAGMAPDGSTHWQGEQAVTRAELAAVLHRADGVIAGALG